MSLADVIRWAEQISTDFDYGSLAAWKKGGGHAVGCAPAYVPAEVLEGCGALAVHLPGGGVGLEVVRGDAFFQSAICHLPRSLVELAVAGKLDSLDLLVIPSTCDVMRNLTGMWQVIWPKRPVHLFEAAQRFDKDGFRFYRRQLDDLIVAVERATGLQHTAEGLHRAIAAHNERRRLLIELEQLRDRSPWLVPTSELYLVVRAGAQMKVNHHVDMLRSYIDTAKSSGRAPQDVARVVLSGAFCEQPPVGFLRTLERAGCAIVADDLLLGLRWLRSPVDESAADPLDALAEAYLSHSPPAPCRWEADRPRGRALVDSVKTHQAQGVILASPSFCDPALLDRPALIDDLDRAGIPCVQLQYAENSVDFGSVREQAGTFADGLRLFENP